MKFNFTINTILLSLLGAFIGYNVLKYYSTPTDVYQPPIGALPVPIEVGRSKIYVSKERDASMATEIRRRRAIIGSNSCAIHPKFGHSGSTNGSLETFFISGLCPTFVKDSISTICALYDGGDATMESQLVLDGGDATDDPDAIEIDLGRAQTTAVCFI
jgi:hypothetical protein